MRRGHLGQLGLHCLPDRHGVDADALAGEAGHEDLPAEALLDERAETVGDLESSLVIDFRRGVPPEDGLLLHFGPLWSTEMVGSRQSIVNAKDGGIFCYVFTSPSNLLTAWSSTTGRTIGQRVIVRRARASISFPHASRRPDRTAGHRQDHTLSAHDGRSRGRPGSAGAGGRAESGSRRSPTRGSIASPRCSTPKKHTPATVEFADLAVAGAERQGAGGRGRVQERRRAGARGARVHRSGGAARRRIGRPGARRAGDGRRADPGGPWRGRAPARTARQGREEIQVTRPREGTRPAHALQGRARKRHAAARARIWPART